MAGPSVAEEGGAAVVSAERHGRDPGRACRLRARRGQVVGQGALKIRRLVGEPLPRRRVPCGAGRDRAAFGLHRAECRADAELCECRRLCRCRHDGRHLGDCRLLRADRQELPSLGRGRYRRRARAATGGARDHRGQLLHRRAQRGRRRGHRRDRCGVGDGHLHRRDDQDRRPRHRRNSDGPCPRLFGRRAGLASGQGSPGRPARTEPLLRSHRQEGRRKHPRPHLDQRVAARMSAAALDAAALAAALIRRPSVTPKDEGALEIVAAELERLGFTCHRRVFGEIHNLYARRGDDRPNLCFAGHTDVVPAGAAEAWSFDPFAASRRGGALCGRGAVDMKGAIAAFIAAAQRYLADRERGLTGSISLLITGDEEGDAINGTRKVLEWLASRGEVIDACLVGEPTSAQFLGDMIKIGRRGSMTGRLTVHGMQGHTAYPHLADNAAHRLVAMLHALTTVELDGGSEHFQPSTLQVSTIDIGNPASNVIPAAARAVLNIRFNDCWTSEMLRGWLTERLDALGGRYSLDVTVGGESFLVAPGDVAERLAEAVRRVTGRTPEFSTTGGTSDARFIQAFCPVAELGLVGQTMHKADERVALADLAGLTEIYENLLGLFFESP